MRTALLIRGISFLPSYVHFSRAIHRIDFRVTAPGLIRQLISPLADRCGGFDNVDLFVVTYRSNDEQERGVRETFGRAPLRLCGSEFHPHMSHPLATQVGLMTSGLQMVLDYSRERDIVYDRVLVTRFDVAFHEGVDVLSYLMPLKDDECPSKRFLFTWRERPTSLGVATDAADDDEAWGPGCQVGDAVHSLPGDRADLDAFVSALITCPVRNNMHEIYLHLVTALTALTALTAASTRDSVDIVALARDRIGLMIAAGFLDSNTDRANNPIYRLHRHVLRRHVLHNTNFYSRFSANMPVQRFMMMMP